MRIVIFVLFIGLLFSSMAFAEVTFGPVRGDIDLQNNGEYDCQFGADNICRACVQDVEDPGQSTDPLIVAFGGTGLSGWSEGRIIGTVSPFVVIDGVTLPPSLLPTGSFFRSGLVVVSQVTPVRPCSDQGFDYQIGPFSGNVNGSANIDIDIPADVGDVIPFQFDFCSVSSFWGVGCNIAGSSQKRWVLHMPESPRASVVMAGNPAPISFPAQGLVVDFEQSGGGLLTIIRSEQSAPVGPQLSGPGGYWEVKTDLVNGTFLAIVTVDFDPAALPSGLDPEELKLARYDSVAGGWESLASTVDVAASEVTAITDSFSVLVLTTDSPVGAADSSWGAIKARY